MTANANVHSHMIRELAQAVTANPQVPLMPAQAEQVKAYLEMLADIHEDLSDFEFDSDSFDRINEIFRTHGLDLFEIDSSLDSDSLKAKYAGDDSEEIFQPAMHPKYPKHEWLTMAAENKTVLGYWEWVESQISQED